MNRHPAMICGRSPRFVYAVNCTQRFFLGNRLRFPCGNGTVAVAMHFAMKNGQFASRCGKFLAISPAIQKIASDCSCDAVVHLDRGSGGGRVRWGRSGREGPVAPPDSL